jgi:hypothetical protein
MLDADSQDELRQSQIEPNEIVRVLGFHERHVLIMKLDKVLGWVTQTDIAISPEIKSFEPVKSLMLQPDEFFDLWEGTPYLWGGITRYGIDCSGLTQRYFKDVLNCIIPKNSNDQRRIGLRKELADVAEHDLVFCTRIGGRGIHHVAIYINGGIWHADGKLGVMNQSLNDFVSNWKILDVVSLNREKLTCSAALL